MSRHYRVEDDMTLQFLSALLGVPLTTTRRACAKLGLTPRRVGRAYALTDAEAERLAVYFAERSEKCRG